MLDVFLIAAAALALIFVTASAVRSLVARITIYEYERGLRFDRGRVTGVVPPGVYWVLRRRTRVDKLDVRPRVVTVPGQEVVTADGVSLRVSVAMRIELVDPVVATIEVEDYHEALHLAAQLALREIVSSAPIEQLLEHRGEIGPRLAERIDPRVGQLGLKLLQVDVKDLMFPGDLRRTFAQVVAARQEGLAALERARGETAALRNLANAARMIEGNPNLLQLRLLQQLGSSGGNTIVLGMPSSTTPLPLRSRDDDVEPPELPSQPDE